ncbi:transcription factor bHLH117-like [Cucurbita maxima]|uniref:Transcription factor bHLH117-like n=1 Tax=Cucurbita maxima TaxID=3661 RepID=A0A6J1JEN1_CUCMA|nr:transcription factor bHLH117-like [Cucurbita maxima]
MVEPMMRECEVSSSAAVSPTVQIPRSALTRQRRQKLSDKTRCLQKLLPWDKKMDISTMLEEAFKYVKFLQAQLLALQSMPCESAISTNSNHHISGVFGGLERLSRNQLLQVLVNSPVVQTMLCSQSCCVFSAEQLGLIQKIAEKRVLLQQISTFRHKP